MSELTIEHLRILYRTFAEKSIPRMSKEQKQAILAKHYGAKELQKNDANNIRSEV